MDHGNKRSDVFNFIFLQMSDLMPLYILWQYFIFGYHFLHFILAEERKPEVGGEREVMITMPFQAIYSSSDATQLKIERA